MIRRASHGSGIGGLSSIDYFGLGDSVASGMGLDDRGECRRSRWAYPCLVARALGTGTGADVRLYHLASSGSVVNGCETEPHRRFSSHVDRVLEVLAGSPAERVLVSVTIGGNDLGRAFAEAGRAHPIRTARAVCGGGDAAFDAIVDRCVRDVDATLRFELARLLRDPRVYVIVTEMYQPLGRRSRWSRVCRPRGRLYERAEAAVDRVNAAFHAAAASLRDVFGTRVSVAPIRAGDAELEGFRGHEMADPRTSSSGAVGVTWMQVPLDGRVRYQRGDCFHPNVLGQERIAAFVLREAARLGFRLGAFVCERGWSIEAARVPGRGGVSMRRRLRSFVPARSLARAAAAVALIASCGREARPVDACPSRPDAQCTSVRSADVDGDGLRDRLAAYRVRKPDGAVSQWLRAKLSSAGTREVDLESDADRPGLPEIVGSTDADGVEGEEVFVATAFGAASRHLEIVTFAGGRLRVVRAEGDDESGSFRIVVDGALYHAGGGRCRSGADGHRIVRTAVHAYSGRDGYWQWLETTYRWEGKRLVRAGERTGYIEANPDDSIDPTELDRYANFRCGRLDVPVG